MSVKRLDLGAVSAYAMAVEQGYQGTEEEFGLILANAANYAAESKTAKIAAEAAAVESAGSAQAAEGYKTAAVKILEDVRMEGTSQIQAISTAGEEEIQDLEAKGTEQIQAIETAGSEQTEAAKAEIDAKGKQTLDSIPEDYIGLQTEVDELKSDLDVIASRNSGNTPDIWEQGSITNSNGKNSDSTTRLRTVNYISSYIARITTDDKYVFEIFAYDASGVYVGVWNGSEFVKSAVSPLSNLDFSVLSDYNYKYKLKFYRGNNATITVDDYNHIHFYNEIYTEIDNLCNNVNDDIHELSEETLDEINIDSLWENGGISIGDGLIYKDSKRIRTKSYISKSVKRIYSDADYKFLVFFYDADGNYEGVFNGTAIATDGSFKYVSEFDTSQFADHNIRINVYNVNNIDLSAVNDYAKIHFENKLYATINDNSKMISSIDSTIKSDLNSESLWEFGGVRDEDGVVIASNYNIITKDYLSSDVSLIYAENDYYLLLAVYDTNDNWIGYWYGDKYVKEKKKSFYFNTEVFNDCKLKVIARKTNNDLVESDAWKNIHFLPKEKSKSFCITPTLTFIDDDGSAEALSNWESIADDLGIGITSALMTGVVGEKGSVITWEEVERLQNKGFEFISHTHNHRNVETWDEELLKTEFVNSINALKAHGCESRYIVYPFNAISWSRIPLVKKYFSAGIGYGPTDNRFPIYTYWLRRYSITSDTESKEIERDGELITVSEYQSLDTLKGFIDSAIKNCSWVIIMTHLSNREGVYYDESSKQLINDLCKYAISKGVKIETFGKAFDRYKNRIDTNQIESIYGTGHYYIADGNGIIHKKL